MSLLIPPSTELTGTQIPKEKIRAIAKQSVTDVRHIRQQSPRGNAGNGYSTSTLQTTFNPGPGYQVVFTLLDKEGTLVWRFNDAIDRDNAYDNAVAEVGTVLSST